MEKNVGGAVEVTSVVGWEEGPGARESLLFEHAGRRGMGDEVTRVKDGKAPKRLAASHRP